MANAVTKGYDPAIAEVILLKVADGATLREIEALDGMPKKSTIQRWIMKYPALTQAWKAARELSAATLEDDALDMARTLRDATELTSVKVRAFEVAMNQFRWSASHRDPAQYGTTQQAPITVPIQINTTLDLGQGGVKTQTQASTYEVAAKVATDYNDRDAQIEGTDYTMEPGEPEETLAPEAPRPLAIKQRGKPGRPKKGHKSPAQTQATITRRMNRNAKATEAKAHGADDDGKAGL